VILEQFFVVDAVDVLGLHNALFTKVVEHTQQTWAVALLFRLVSI
jgi:hypothetical protein